MDGKGVGGTSFFLCCGCIVVCWVSCELIVMKVCCALQRFFIMGEIPTVVWLLLKFGFLWNPLYSLGSSPSA